jgi:NAD(P)-dependent dehydrogenase (short-subunit alcohol dehydrogenase family)
MAEFKVALVTGANKGIGLEIVRSLAGHGMTSLLGGRDQERREKAAAALRADGLDVHPIALDVTDPSTIGAAAAHIDERFGHLDVLVNNAGTSGGFDHPPSEADLDVVREVFDTNVFGVIRVINAVLPLLRRSAAGRIINVSSEWGSMTRTAESDLPAQIDYPTSKAALNAITVQYATELREHGISVNSVAPGLTATDFTKDLGFEIPRTATEGAAIAVRMATLEGDGPTGSFFDDDGEVPW